MTPAQRLLDAAQRLVAEADFRLGGVLSNESKARNIPSNAYSQVKARHLASLRDAVHAALAETAEPVAGWKLVPVEPTPEMVDKGGYADTEATDSYTGDFVHCIGDDAAREAYRAMLNAAPQPPAPEFAPDTDLLALADKIDHEQNWRLSGIDQRDQLTQDQRDRLLAGVMLRRYADLMAPDSWRIFPPKHLRLVATAFRASTLEKAVEMVRADLKRHGKPEAQPPAPAVEWTPPTGMKVVDVGFVWDGETQLHTPKAVVHFESVPANSPANSKGWQDRDAFVSMISSARAAIAAHEAKKGGRV